MYLACVQPENDTEPDNVTTPCLLAGIICGLLTQQYLAVNDEQEATQSNSAVREFHQDVFCDVVSTRIHPQISFTRASLALHGLYYLPAVIGGKNLPINFLLSRAPPPPPRQEKGLYVSQVCFRGFGWAKYRKGRI